MSHLEIPLGKGNMRLDQSRAFPARKGVHALVPLHFFIPSVLLGSHSKERSLGELGKITAAGLELEREGSSQMLQVRDYTLHSMTHYCLHWTSVTNHIQEPAKSHPSVMKHATYEEYNFGGLICGWPA